MKKGSNYLKKIIKDQKKRNKLQFLKTLDY